MTTLDGVTKRKPAEQAAGFVPAPPNLAFRCAFVARQIEVKTDYQLRVSGKEKDAMRQVLRDC